MLVLDLRIGQSLVFTLADGREGRVIVAKGHGREVRLMFGFPEGVRIVRDDLPETREAPGRAV